MHFSVGLGLEATGQANKARSALVLHGSDVLRKTRGQRPRAQTIAGDPYPLSQRLAMDRCQHLAAAAGTAKALSPVSIGLPASRAEPRDRAGWLVSCSPGSPAAQRGRVCSMPAPTMLRQRLARRAPCRRPTVGGRVPWCLLQRSAATVHRSLDSLNCRWSTVRSLGADAEGDWHPGRGGWPAGRHFQGAKGEKNARRFEVYGYVFSARKPS